MDRLRRQRHGFRDFRLDKFLWKSDAGTGGFRKANHKSGQARPPWNKFKNTIKQHYHYGIGVRCQEKTLQKKMIYTLIELRPLTAGEKHELQKLILGHTRYSSKQKLSGMLFATLPASSLLFPATSSFSSSVDPPSLPSDFTIFSRRCWISSSFCRSSSC